MLALLLLHLYTDLSSKQFIAVWEVGKMLTFVKMKSASGDVVSCILIDDLYVHTHKP